MVREPHEKQARPHRDRERTLPGIQITDHEVRVLRKSILSLGTSSQHFKKRNTFKHAYKPSQDGGGIRGYSSLMILEKLMGEIQKSLGLPSAPSPCEYFDITGGTGTGGYTDAESSFCMYQQS